LKKKTLLILFIYNIQSIFPAAPALLEEPVSSFFVLTNIACKISLLCKIKNPNKEEGLEEEEIKEIASEPGRKLTINLPDKTSLLLLGIGVRPHQNLLTKYSNLSTDTSHPEYGTFFTEPLTLGINPLAIIINETYNVEGYSSEKGVYCNHNVQFILRSTGNPQKEEPILKTLLLLQPSSENEE
jgi:hypothetical protein